MEFDIREILTIGSAIVAVAGSHFMLRARIMVLEERIKGHGKAMERVFSCLKRIEEKLDGKQDRAR